MPIDFNSLLQKNLFKITEIQMEIIFTKPKYIRDYKTRLAGSRNVIRKLNIFREALPIFGILRNHSIYQGSQNVRS